MNGKASLRKAVVVTGATRGVGRATAVALAQAGYRVYAGVVPDVAVTNWNDAAVAEGVKRFQLRHGLDVTGSVGAQTLKALNVPVGDRIKQLEASVERLLGMDFIFAERYVVVNIPAAFVEASNASSCPAASSWAPGDTWI